MDKKKYNELISQLVQTSGKKKKAEFYRELLSKYSIEESVKDPWSTTEISPRNSHNMSKKIWEISSKFKPMS